MTTATDDSRLGVLEGRMIELSASVQDLREDLREGLREVRQELREVNARVDRLFLAILGIGAAQIALLITLIVTLIIRTG